MRSAGGSTGSRWRSSWPRRARVDEPGRHRRASRRTVPAPDRQAPRPGGAPPDACGRRSSGPTSSSTTTNGRSSTASACSPVPSTPRRRSRSRAATTSTVGRSPTRSSSLVAKSMLGAETGPDGTTRYAMLETLRQFARERLDETGDTDRWRRAPRRVLRELVAHDAGYGLTGPDDVALDGAAARRARQRPRRGRLGARSRRPRRTGTRRCASSPRSTGSRRQRLRTWGSARWPRRPSPVAEVVAARAARTGVDARGVPRVEPGPR